MIPKLFNANATVFTSHGIGNLKDALSCAVTKNGMIYDLQMDYPITGKRFADISERKIIVAKPDQVDGEQPFRIYRISKPINGKVTIFAHHISYDLSGIPVDSFTATSAADFASKLNNNALISCPFTFSTNVNEVYTFANKTPVALRSILGGSDNTWQGQYGGELKFDGYQVSLLQRAGQDRGVKIRYGVDLVDSRMEDNIDNVFTGIIPYYIGQEDNSASQSQYDVKVVGDVQNAPGTFDYVKVKPVDVSQYIASTPSKETVNSIGRQWLQDNEISKPLVNLTLSYAQLKQVVQQYDTITVEIVRLGVDVKANVTKTVFDVLNERYSSVEIGSVRPTLSGDIYDASRLRKGLLPVERIRDHSITSEKYGVGSVGSSAMANWSVVRQKLKDKAVDKDQLEDEAVANSKLREKAVSRLKLDEELEGIIVDLIYAKEAFIDMAEISGGKVISLSVQVMYLNGYRLVAGDRFTVYDHTYYGKGHTGSVGGSTSENWSHQHTWGDDYYYETVESGNPTTYHLPSVMWQDMSGT